MTFGPANTIQAYLPTEQDFPEDPKILREILANHFRIVATCLNIRENSQYEKVEVLTGNQYNSQVVMGAIQTQYSIRLWFDCVAFNGAPIPPGITTLTLTTSTIPALINIPNSLQPMLGTWSASDGATFYFTNDPLVNIRTNAWTNVLQTVVINNTTGNNLVSLVFTFEYIKS